MIKNVSSPAPLPFSFERAPTPALLAALSAGGPLGFISQLVRGDNLWDLGFRGSRVDIYRGRCVVLQVEEDNAGQLRLAVESAKLKKAGFDPGWSSARAAAELEGVVPALRAYLEAVCRLVPASMTSGEAVYHGALTHHRLPALPDVIVIDREAVLGCDVKAADRDRALQRPRQSYDRLARESIGKEADALAVAADGSTLFVVEVKTDVTSVDKAVAQACWYAALFRWWVGQDRQLASQTIQQLATARRTLGLAPPLTGGVDIERVLPVIAFPRSTGEPSPSALEEGARRLTGALGHDGVAPLLWELDNRRS